MFEVAEFTTDVFSKERSFMESSTRTQVITFIEAHYSEDAKNVFISNSLGEVV